MKFHPPQSLVQGPIKDFPDQSNTSEFSAYQQIRLRIPIDFRTMMELSPTTTSDPMVALPTFRVHGFNWTLSCFKGLPGSPNFVSVSMKLLEPSPLSSKLQGRFEFEVAEIPSSRKTLSASAMNVEKAWGLSKFVLVDTIRDCAVGLEGGQATLIVRVSISKAQLRPTPFRPQLNGWSQPLLEEILSHGSPRTRVVNFAVGSESSTLHLPCKLCEQRLPQLASLLKTDDNSDEQEAIQVDGLIETMSLEAFRMFLSIVVAGITPDTANAIEQYPLKLLDLADRFGFVELKIYIESHLAEFHMVDIETGLYFLTIAHARNCFLLKECCMDCLNSPHMFCRAIQSRQWKDVVEATPELLRDMYRHLGLNQPNTPCPPLPISRLYNNLEIWMGRDNRSRTVSKLHGNCFCINISILSLYTGFVVWQ